MIGANVAGRMMRRSDRYKRIAVAGCSLATVGLFALAAMAGTAPFWLIEVMIALIGFGVGTQFPVVTVSVQNAAEQRDLGVATAALAFLRSLGSVIGVAILGAILINTGITAAVGEGLHRAADSPVGDVGAVFAIVFAVAGFSQLIGVGLLLLMEERPLRGRPMAAAATE